MGSNTNMLSSFNVDKMSNGMRKIELNGKELVQADFNVGDNTVSQTTTLPDGRSLTTTVSWQSDDLKKNRVNVKLDGTERNKDYLFDLQKDFDGKKMGVTLNNGKFSITV